MKKMTIQLDDNLTFKEGFQEFIDNCKVRNLREGTLKHYRESYVSIIRYFDESTMIKDIDKKIVDNFILRCAENHKIGSQTLYTYVRDFKTILYFFMRMEYMPTFKITLTKVDRKPIECYSDSDLQKLLKQPDLKKCSFAEYRNYCIVATLLATGIRLSSLTNIKIKDIDFDNEIVNVMHTKNRKPLIIPLNRTIVKILKQYLKVRQYKSEDDYLFCNVHKKQLKKSAITTAIYNYNRSRGVNKTSIHKFRHTFAKKWVMQNNSVVVLQRILGHSSLSMTQNYLNILVSDVKKEMDNFNILEEFQNNHIKMKKN